MSTQPTAHPGWYTQPDGTTRYWNGSAYTATPPGLPRAAPHPTATSNPAGVTALVLAIIGAAFCLLPGMYVIPLFLLPPAFILAIVAICLPAPRPKTTGVAALIISLLGGLTATIIALTRIAEAIRDAGY